MKIKYLLLLISLGVFLLTACGEEERLNDDLPNGQFISQPLPPNAGVIIPHPYQNIPPLNVVLYRMNHSYTVAECHAWLRIAMDVYRMSWPVSPCRNRPY